MTLLVVKPGLLSTVQDRGRTGWQQFGVPVGGALDELSLRIANLLVGNELAAPGIEMVMSGAAFECIEDTIIAVCGADMDGTIDGVPLPMYRPLHVTAGSTLRFGSAAAGRCAYVAIAGGCDVPKVLGSHSASIRSPFSGLAGRPLRSGDRIPAGRSVMPWEGRPQHWRVNGSFAEPGWSVGPRWRLHASRQMPHVTVRVVAGREWESFPVDIREALSDSGMEFMLRSDSDRMGYRLDGPELRSSGRSGMLSEAVTFGTMQVPPDGKPIVLMADRQTTGGYPRLAQVAAVDLPILVQARPGERVRFKLIGLDEAVGLFLQREREIRWLQWRVGSASS